MANKQPTKTYIWNGIKYNGMKALREGTGSSAAYGWTLKGINSQEEADKCKHNAVVQVHWNETNYKNRAQLAKTKGRGILYWYKQGFRNDADVNEQKAVNYRNGGIKNKHPITIDGVIYDSKAEAAKSLGVTPSAISKRISRGTILK